MKTTAQVSIEHFFPVKQLELADFYPSGHVFERQPETGDAPPEMLPWLLKVAKQSRVGLDAKLELVRGLHALIKLIEIDERPTASVLAALRNPGGEA